MKKLTIIIAVLGIIMLGKVHAADKYLEQRSGIFDYSTGLLWQKCPVGQEGHSCKGTSKLMTLPMATEWAAQSDGWRLPTQAELLTIVKNKENTNLFPRSPNQGVWSNTKADSSGYWAVNLVTGYDDPVNSNTPMVVRLVKRVK